MDTRPHPLPPGSSAPRPRRGRSWLIAGGILLVLIGLLATFWNWDWFRPLVAYEASAELGRRVTLQHFDLHPGRQTVAVADGVAIANPPGFPADRAFATIGRLTVTIDVMSSWHLRQPVIPAIQVDQPRVDAEQQPDGTANWGFPALSGPAGEGAQGRSPKIAAIGITGGRAHVVIPRLKADFGLAIATTEATGSGTPAQLRIDAKGSYAGQPLVATFTGGALLTLRDAANPYPVDLRVVDGPTHVALTGTVQDPLAFAGADLKLQLAGPDMSLLYPLTDVPIPKTPPFQVTGDLAYAGGKVEFHHFAGQVGSSDLEGDLDFDTSAQRPVLSGTLASRRVDLADLGGFIGSQPGRMSTPNQTPEQRRELAAAEASPQFLPTTPINLPELHAIDVHVTYRGARIEGRSMPFDSFAADLSIDDGRIRLTPVSLGVGQGRITGNIDLTPVGKQIHARGDIAVQRVDIGRMLEATHLVNGAGLLGGKATIDTTGNSLAAMLGNGNGGVQLFMAGGNLSALLVDLAGLEFGNALLSALGIPQRAEISCFVSDFGLEHGVLDTRTLILDTSEAVVTGTGTIDLRTETLDYLLRTQSKHFTIGSLPAPIGITGKFKSPSIKPDIGALALRGGAVAALAVVFPPAALLPTIQFGVGDDHRCADLVHGAAPAQTPAETPAQISARAPARKPEK